MKSLENKVIRLVEERGYMGTKYISVVREIIKYIETYILTNEKTTEDGWRFYLPNIITDKIDCIANLIIEVEIIDNINGYKYSGGGNCSVLYSNRIVNDKLEYGRISLKGFSYGTDLYSHTIFGTISHELNHAMEMYERIKKRQSAIGIYKRSVDQRTILDYKFSDDEATNNIIREFFYRLLFKSELNALINSVYGDLETRGSVRKNFKKDIKITSAYAIYDSLSKEIGLFNDDLLEDYEWENIMKCFNYISVNGAKHYSNLKYFKKRFKQFIISKLNTLMKGIGRIASFYYDNMEDATNDKTTINITDPNVKIM